MLYFLVNPCQEIQKLENVNKYFEHIWCNIPLKRNGVSLCLSQQLLSHHKGSDAVCESVLMPGKRQTAISVKTSCQVKCVDSSKCYYRSSLPFALSQKRTWKVRRGTSSSSSLGEHPKAFRVLLLGIESLKARSPGVKFNQFHLSNTNIVPSLGFTTSVCF